MIRTATAFLLALALAAPALASHERAHIHIKEWRVPWPNATPRSPVQVRPDTVWFVAETGNFIGRLDPQTGRFSRVDLVDRPAPRGLIAGAGDNPLLWYTGSAHSYIGRFDPERHTIARVPMPYAAASDPTSLTFEAGQRNIWFTVREGNIIGRLRLVNEVVDLAGLTTPHALPSGIAMAPNAGNPWVALFGTNKLATIDARTFKLTEQALPRAAARPRRVAFTSDGRLWYSDFAQGYLGAFTPADRSFKEWALPEGPTSHPYALAVDAQDRIWTVETGTQPNKLVGFDPKTGKFFDSTPIPSGGGAVRDMRYDSASGGLWFATDANTIAFAKVG